MRIKLVLKGNSIMIENLIYYIFKEFVIGLIENKYIIFIIIYKYVQVL